MGIKEVKHILFEMIVSFGFAVRKLNTKIYIDIHL